jgi:predicted RND superfamily exporter protein
VISAPLVCDCDVPCTGLWRSAPKRGIWTAWVAAREEQWRGIVYSDVIIAAGFAIFVLSDFPPTQRFGLVVLAGCIIDILANLFVLPLLGGAQWKKK